MDPIKETKEVYNQTAKEYEKENSVMTPELLSFAKKFSKMLLRDKKDSKARILDAGCGAGRDLKYFQKLGFEVYGCDLSMELVRQARAIADAKIFLADVRNLPFDHLSFSGIWSIATLSHLTKKDLPKALEQFRRSLHKEGIIAMTLHEGHTQGYEPSPLDLSQELYVARYSLKEAEKCVKEAGFKIIHSRQYTENDSWIEIIARVSIH